VANITVSFRLTPIEGEHSRRDWGIQAARAFARTFPRRSNQQVGHSMNSRTSTFIAALALALSACSETTPPPETPAAAAAEDRAEKAEDAAATNTDRAEKAADKAEDSAAASDKSADKAEKAADDSKK
jgi:hypothetical protein